MADPLDSLTEDDLPNDVLQYVAEVAGIEVVRKLLIHCPGMRLDIPVRPKRDFAKRYIELNYDGHNAKILATKLGMSEAFVYKVLKEKSAMKPAAREA
jgi:Mor family transcriptional regulator